MFGVSLLYANNLKVLPLFSFYCRPKNTEFTGTPWGFGNINRLVFIQ